MTLLVIQLIWFGYVARYPSGEEGDIVLVQMTTTCLEEGEGESVPCGYGVEFKGKMMNLKKISVPKSPTHIGLLV